MTDHEQTYRLPLLARSTRLAPLPGQSPNDIYDVTTAIPGPEGSRGYLVKVVGRRRVRIVAWLSGDLCVYPTDRPLEREPEGSPQLQFDPWSDRPDAGAVDVWDGPHDHVTVGEYEGKGDRIRITTSVTPLGFYAEGRHPMATLLAVTWIANCLLRQHAGQKAGAGGGRIKDLLLPLTEKPLPDALDEIMYRGTLGGDDSTPFLRYAARQVAEANAALLRPIAARHDISVLRLGSTSLFWMNFADELTDAERTTLLCVEAALNRLAYAEQCAKEHDNDVGLASTLDDATLDATAFRFLHGWAERMRFVTGRADLDNPWQTVRGTTARRGGIWDVTTRFIATCERLVLPYRLEYRAQADPDSGGMAIRFALPDASAFPASKIVDGAWHDISQGRQAAASAYALRLAGLLAQAAFTAGTALTHVDVIGTRGTLSGEPVLRLGFDRTPFTMGTAAAYARGDLDTAQGDADPALLLTLLAPSVQDIRLAADGTLAAIDEPRLPDALRVQRTVPWRDERPLPEELRGLLRADRACDLDVMHDDSAISGAEVLDLYHDNEDSPVSASLELESALMQLEGAQGDHGERQPLYCEYPVMRLMVSLAPGNDATRYWKVPDGTYNAHLAIGRLNRNEGKLQPALDQEEECMRIAPTGVQPYLEESITLVDVADDYARSADLLIRALSLAVMPMDVGFTYYRLAYALWKQGSKREALACYAMVLTMRGASFTQHARNESQELMEEMGVHELPDREQAHRVLRAAGIPVAPVEGVLSLVAKATIGLVDAGMPMVAEHGAWVLWSHAREDELQAMRRCLVFGAGPVPEDLWEESV